MTGKEHAETFYPGATEYMQQAIAADFDAGIIEGKRQSQEKIDRLLDYADHYIGCITLLTHGVRECDCGCSELITEIEKEKS